MCEMIELEYCIKNRKKYLKYCLNHVVVWKLSHFSFFFSGILYNNGNNILE